MLHLFPIITTLSSIIASSTARPQNTPSPDANPSPASNAFCWGMDPGGGGGPSPSNTTTTSVTDPWQTACTALTQEFHLWSTLLRTYARRPGLLDNPIPLYKQYPRAPAPALCEARLDLMPGVRRDRISEYTLHREAISIDLECIRPVAERRGYAGGVVYRLGAEGMLSLMMGRPPLPPLPPSGVEVVDFVDWE